MLDDGGKETTAKRDGTLHRDKIMENAAM